MAIKHIEFKYLSPQKHYEIKLRAEILRVAQLYIGTSYQYGAKEFNPSIDCSGYITNVLNEALQNSNFRPNWDNIAKLRTSPLLKTTNNPEDGDLILWRGHGGIVWDTNNGQFIGAQTSTGVAIASYTDGYWAGQPGIIFRKYGHYFTKWFTDNMNVLNFG